MTSWEAAHAELVMVVNGSSADAVAKLVFRDDEEDSDVLSSSSSSPGKVVSLEARFSGSKEYSLVIVLRAYNLVDSLTKEEPFVANNAG